MRIIQGVYYMKFYQSNLLKRFSNITSAFTTKESKNLAFHVGDIADNVIKNHKLLANELKYNYKTLVHMKQIHSNDVLKISKEHNFYTPPTCDALITQDKNTPLMVMATDCAPILFYDPKKEVIAVAHAGRKGVFTNIVGNVLAAFSIEYGSKCADIFVSVGANIHACCYEVGEEIDAEAEALGYKYAMEQREGRFYLDINKIIKTQLLEAGVNATKIEFLKVCTSCSDANLYSYRREKETGRFAGIISLKN